MSELTDSVVNMIDQLAKLPGIGRKSAERLAYHILRIQKSEALALADSIREVRENVSYCEICFNLAEGKICKICEDERRNQSVLCIVQQPRDLIAIEQSGQYNGIYHVLLGRIAPLENIGPDQLTIDQLVARVHENRFVEVIMGTNPTVEGDGTALHISNLLSQFGVKITKLARGITQGSILEYTNKEIVADAITGRQPF